MAPLLVLRGDRPLLAVGAPGGHRIINALAQVITNVLDAGMGIQDAITTPRIDCSGPNVVVDSRIPEHVVAGLERIGHRIEVVEESVHANHFSRPVGILIDPDGDQLHGGVDPFRVAVAAGY